MDENTRLINAAANRRVEMPHIQGATFLCLVGDDRLCGFCAGGSRLLFILEIGFVTPVRVAGLRFIAMTWIIFFHYLSTEQGTLVHNIVNHRPLDLFTVISGFATHLAYGSHKRSLGTPVQFLARRASRLVFTYYLTLNISFFLKLISLGATSPSMGEVAMEYLNFILALLGLNVWVCPALLIAGQPQGSTIVQTLCWPHNGPLWYTFVMCLLS